MPTGGPLVPLVAREPELRALHAALSRVEQGETAAVFVIGESGVGKTHLLREAETRMRERGAVVLSGLSLDIRDAPLYPLATALRRFVAEAEPEQEAQTAPENELMMARGEPADRGEQAQGEAPRIEKYPER